MNDEIIDAFECVFCGKWTTEYDAIPSFYEGNGKHATEYCDNTQCVCHPCSEKHLNFNEAFGDYQLKENCIRPEQARPTPNRDLGVVDADLMNYTHDPNSTSKPSTTFKSSGIGFAGFLTIIFIILKLNPGGYLTSSIVDWPWFKWWGVSVFCPLLFSFYLFLGILGLFGIIFVVGFLLHSLFYMYGKNR